MQEPPQRQQMEAGREQQLVRKPYAETLGDPFIRGLPLRIPLSRKLKPDDRKTMSIQPIAERTPARVRLARLLNGHKKIMRGLE